MPWIPGSPTLRPCPRGAAPSMAVSPPPCLTSPSSSAAIPADVTSSTSASPSITHAAPRCAYTRHPRHAHPPPRCPRLASHRALTSLASAVHHRGTEARRTRSAVWSRAACRIRCGRSGGDYTLLSNSPYPFSLPPPPSPGPQSFTKNYILTCTLFLFESYFHYFPS
ncbi:hypothetical protein B0H14DRAFT_1355262, partial [Mycena olivaceomarginata]